MQSATLLATLLAIVPITMPFAMSNITAKVLASMMANSHKVPPGTYCDFEEDDCAWKWNTSVSNGFRVVTAVELIKTIAGYREPVADASNNTKGHFLLWEVNPGDGELHVWSPEFSHTRQQCRLHVSLNMVNMSLGLIKLVVEAKNYTSWLVEEMSGNSNNKWQTHVFAIGKITQDFRIFLEVSPNRTFHSRILMDNIQLVNCFPETPSYKPCSKNLFHCSKDSDDFCINKTHVCDIVQDCWNGEDEKQNCDLVPEFGRCTFEDGWCGWENSPTSTINWTRQNGSTYARRITGPGVDHTYQNLTGIYLYVNMSTMPTTKLGASALLESPIINPPPPYHSRPNSTFYKSCFVRFFYHLFGPNSGSLGLFLNEKKPSGDKNSRLWFTYGDKGDKWQQQIVQIPTDITNGYVLQFEARRGLRARGDVAIDDVSMSPECFGYNVPVEEKGDYNYTIQGNFPEPTPSAIEHVDFVNKTVYVFTSCGAKGRFGPTPQNCTKAYNGTNVNVTVLEDATLLGVQRWIVPEEGYYTIIAKGASGGRGSDGQGFSKAATSIGVIQLNRTQSVYIIVGHEGGNACHKNFAFTRHSTCGTSLHSKKWSKIDALKEIKNIEMIREGGGGGGASVVFLWSKIKGRIPLVIGAGGGGLGEYNAMDSIQHGHAMERNRIGVTGMEAPNVSAGAGGGWSESNMTWREVTGQAIILGALGGKACATSFDHHGIGGFGGGGGGCTTGGGGGGYAGGSSYPDRSSNGYGGYSYAWHMLNISNTMGGSHIGRGGVIIIPAIEGCGCMYRCAALDEYREKVTCLCPNNWKLNDNGRDCTLVTQPVTSSPDYLYPSLTVVLMVLICSIISVLSYRHYNYLQNKKMLRLNKLDESELQLNRLRVASDHMMTEYNPNYEFGGGTYTIRDLNEIPRDQLRLVKALGQGAFGEVYQGFYRHRAGDILEMPVAVKTLPELSTNQAETDFLMEALIMSKFNHPNIVHFIGVCFDKHPRLIVLELLAGGDLKNFLRESRPKPERPSPLTMRDLLMCCMDVAKGCAYLEEHRFIHRDIAARNCLLTTKGPGRTTKIADFGMARDIYRSDYYRKGGKAMLPIKWMPPEAFQDGIFTSRTDVWSFGVLMWEVMSLGYMPYTGCGNREVMQLVMGGGRLEPPHNCPESVYALMTKCWHPKPDERPSFKILIDRLGYLIQDPEVLSSPLPIFNRLTWSACDSASQSLTTSRTTLRGSHDYLEPTTHGNSDPINGKLLPDNEWKQSFTSESALVQSLIDEPPQSAHHNHNNNNNNINNNNGSRRPLTSALSLDASTLVKQPLPYVNKHGNGPNFDEGSTRHAYTVHNTPSRGHRYNDTEISC